MHIYKRSTKEVWGQIQGRVHNARVDLVVERAQVGVEERGPHVRVLRVEEENTENTREGVGSS